MAEAVTAESIGMRAKTPREFVEWMLGNLPEDATWDLINEYIGTYQLLWRARQQRVEGLSFSSDELRERYGIPR